MLIDVTRLVLRRLRGRLPTGVDRVGLAWLQEHRDSARAVLAWRRLHTVLRVAESQALFAWLLAPPAPASLADGWRVALWCLRGLSFGARSARDLHGSVLLHTAHQGLEQSSQRVPRDRQSPAARGPGTYYIGRSGPPLSLRRR